MSSPYILPFNFQPTNLNIGTAYTIPAGEYGFVTVQVNPSGTFTINGNTAISNPADDSFTAVAVSGGTYDVPAGRIFEGQIYWSGSGVSTFTIGGQTAGELNSTVDNGRQMQIKAGPGQTISIGSNKTLTGYTRQLGRANPPLIATFHVKTGDVLSGAGTRIITAQRFNAYE